MRLEVSNIDFLNKFEERLCSNILFQFDQIFRSEKNIEFASHACRRRLKKECQKRGDRQSENKAEDGVSNSSRGTFPEYNSFKKNDFNREPIK